MRFALCRALKRGRWRGLQEEMLAEAQAMVAERRGPEIAALRTEPGRDRVFAWAGGPPRAGEAAVLAYNKACGALRQAHCRLSLACTCVSFCMHGPSRQEPSWGRWRLCCQAQVRRDGTASQNWLTMREVHRT